MRGLIGDLCIKTYLVNQNPAETCQVFGKNFSGQLYPFTVDLFVFKVEAENLSASTLLVDLTVLECLRWRHR
jgi:hypothetical protein